jgi:hypothetical protein
MNSASLCPSMGARNQVGIGLSYRPASLRSLATQFQNRFLESIPFAIAGLKIQTQYDNPIPTRFIDPIDCLKIPALFLPLSFKIQLLKTFPYKQRAKLQNAFFLRERRISNSFDKISNFCNFKIESFACSAKTSLGSFSLSVYQNPGHFRFKIT